MVLKPECFRGDVHCGLLIGRVFAASHTLDLHYIHVIRDLDSQGMKWIVLAPTGWLLVFLHVNAALSVSLIAFLNSLFHFTGT
jgi:hypothetical protein